MKSDYFNRTQAEEWWNATTHAIPAGVMLCYALFHDNESVVLLSAAMCLTFIFSMLYHIERIIVAKELLRRLDMSSIFLLIGVTGTVYSAASSASLWWLPAALGVFFMTGCMLFYGEAMDAAMVPFSLSLSCVAIAVFTSGDPTLNQAAYFTFGNVLYVAGLRYYLRDSTKWYHLIWHLYVASAAFVHLSCFL